MRLEPLSEPYEPEIAEALRRWMPPGADQDPLVLFRLLHRHPDLAARMRVLGAGFLGHPTIPVADRELVILRVCARCGCEYEWGVHAATLSKQAGLTEEQLYASPDDPVWTQRQRVLLKAVDELHDTSTIGEAVWDELRACYDDQQIIELLVLAGWYRTISYVANATKLPLEPWAYRSGRRG